MLLIDEWMIYWNEMLLVGLIWLVLLWMVAFSSLKDLKDNFLSLETLLNSSFSQRACLVTMINCHHILFVFDLIVYELLYLNTILYCRALG